MTDESHTLILDLASLWVAFLRYVCPFLAFALAFGYLLLQPMIELRHQFDAWWMQTPIYAFFEALPKPPETPPMNVISVAFGVFLGLTFTASILKALRGAR